MTRCAICGEISTLSCECAVCRIERECDDVFVVFGSSGHLLSYGEKWEDVSMFDMREKDKSVFEIKKIKASELRELVHG